MRLTVLSTLATLLITAGPLSASTSNPPDLYPYLQGLSSCTLCHSGSPENPGTGSLSVSGLPAEYEAGARYPVTITVQNAGASRFGFTLMATDTSGTQAGRFHTRSDEIDVRAESGLIFVKQAFNGTQSVPTAPGSRSWTILWQAPADFGGTITFQVRGVAANGDHSVRDDKAYAAEYVVQAPGSVATAD